MNRYLMMVSLLGLAACGGETPSQSSASAEKSGKPTASAKSSASSTSKSSAATTTTASAAVTGSASAAAEDPNACPKDNVPPKFEFAEVDFKWSDAPTLASAPKDKAYANVGDKTFVLPKVEVWISEKEGEITLRTNDGVLLGPALIFKGIPKTGLELTDKLGDNRGYFQMPKKGFTVECGSQTTSYNGKNARALKLTRYDEKTADGSFVTTWEESFGEKRKMWAAGTFKDAKVVIFKK